MSGDFEKFIEEETKKSGQTKQIRIDIETYNTIKKISEKYNLKLIKIVNYAVKNLLKELNSEKIDKGGTDRNGI